MKLDWLGEYRLLMEKIIKCANTYARTYRKKMSYGTDILISLAEIQVLEYILENEEKYQNMAEIALRLGVSSSAFSKNVKQMLSKEICWKNTILLIIRRMLLYSHLLLGEVYILITVDMLKWILLIRWKMF